MKTQILSAIGEQGLQPAAALNAALAANDRIKYYLSLLQMAVDHAAHPEQPAPSLQRERLTCGIDDPDLDRIVGASQSSGKDCRIPGVRRIFAVIADDLRLMGAPVVAAKLPGFAERLAARLAALPAATDDLVAPGLIAAMMQAGHGQPDSLHRLVMDLHKR